MVGVRVGFRIRLRLGSGAGGYIVPMKVLTKIEVLYKCVCVCIFECALTQS